MKLDIVSKDFEVTEAIKSHAEKATAKLEKLKAANVTYNHMALKKDGPHFVSEYEVRTNIGDFFSHSSDPDCYQSITGAVSKLFDQIKKKLDKLQS